MKLKWYGHASFRLESSDGRTIVTDPYDPDIVGFKPFVEPADVVIISSDNDAAHCRADLIPGSPSVVNALAVAKDGGVRDIDGFTIRAIQAMEALSHHDHNPDQNGMYRIAIDGLSVGHMGDIGNPLTTRQIDFFEGVDILLALAGGYPTIDLSDLDFLIKRAQPKLVVPMHFRTLSCKLHNIFWIPQFLEMFPAEQIDFAHTSEIMVGSEQLPQNTRVLVLDYV